jgi:hypothetical protein
MREKVTCEGDLSHVARWGGAKRIRPGRVRHLRRHREIEDSLSTMAFREECIDIVTLNACLSFKPHTLLLVTDLFCFGTAF